MRFSPSTLLLAALLGGCTANAVDTGDGPAPGGGDGAGGTPDVGLLDRDGGGTNDAPMQLGDGGGGPSIPDGAISTHDGSAWCIPRTCQGKTYQCGNCIDDDGDGLIDEEDPDCLGACQNNERGFSGDIPGQNNAPCKADCYFDQDTGSGNDECEWDHRCDPHEVPPAFAPEAGCGFDPQLKFPGGATCADKIAAQAPRCGSFCGPLTPNGCDCFGCCAIPPNNSETDGVYLGSRDANDRPSCDLAHAADPTRCKPCRIVTACFNTCGHCQLCVGKTQLPEDCFGPRPDGGAGGDGGAGDGGLTAPDGGVPGQCPPNIQPCGVPGEPPCPQGYYCITGCCEPIIG